MPESLDHEPMPPRFPAYAYLPGSGMPHPTRHPQGHSYGQESRGDWAEGWRLFQAGYYWEAHEAWEGLWLAHQHDPLESARLRGMIQMAAALLKRRGGNQTGAASLWRKSRAQLSLRPERWRGLDLAEVIANGDLWLNPPQSGI